SMTWSPRPCSSESEREAPAGQNLNTCVHAGALLALRTNTAVRVVNLELPSSGIGEFTVPDGQLIWSFGDGATRAQLRFRREGTALHLETRRSAAKHSPTDRFKPTGIVLLRSSEPVPLLCHLDTKSVP